MKRGRLSRRPVALRKQSRDCASRHLPLGVCLFLSLFAVCRRFSLQPSCHPAVFLLSTFSLPSLLPLSLRSPLPRSAAPLLPVGPLLSKERKKKERKKENRQPKGGMGGRYTATTQGFFATPKDIQPRRECVSVSSHSHQPRHVENTFCAHSCVLGG